MKKEILDIRKPTEQHWVGDGFHVHTMFHPQASLYKYISPFIMMDYAPLKQFSATDLKRGVGEHPHRGFETVTFVYAGEVTHRDSAGGGGTIGKGDIQWMTAASGLVHEEFHSEEFAKNGGDFEMIQLWVNLPAKDKMSKPNYQGIYDKDFPRINLDNNTEIKVYTGSLFEKEGPAKSFTKMDIFDLKINENSKYTLKLPANRNTLILLRKGFASIQGHALTPKDLVVFKRDGEEVIIETKTNSELFVLSAEPIDEPIAAYGPFVMNTHQELVEAMEDYQSGKMGHL